MKQIFFLVVSALIALTSAAQVPADAGAIAGLTNVCANSSANYAVATISGATTYMWTLPAGATITSGYGTSNIAVQFGTTSGDIMVFGGNSSGYGNGSSIHVTVNTAPSVTVSATPASICAGMSTTLTASSTANSYSWSTGANGSSIQVAPTASTMYTVTVSNSSGCQGTGSVNVTVHQLPNVTLNLTENSACQDMNSVVLAGGYPVGGTYSSSGEDIVYGGTTIYPPVNNPNTWTIMYTVTDQYGCTGSASDLFTINPLPVVTFDNIGGSVTTNSPSVDLNNYVEPDGGVFDGPTGSINGHLFSFSAAGPGTHMLTYTYVHPISGCSASQIQYVTIADGGTSTGIEESKNPSSHGCIMLQNGELRVGPNRGVKVFTLNGYSILEGSMETINLNDYPDGMYIIQVITPDGAMVSRRVMKNN